jgi:hypothetical protein
VTGLPLIEVHVNYVWRSLEDVTYPRHEAGSTVQVAPPNSLQAIDVIETGCLLRTHVLSAGRRPLSHCAHYYFNRECKLGGECRFVHAVFIDPGAHTNGLRRAPAPIQLGRYTPSAKGLNGRVRGPNEMVPTPRRSTVSPNSRSTHHSDEGATIARHMPSIVRPLSDDVLWPTESQSLDSLRARSTTPHHSLPEAEH